jgi:fatty-acyl-CoA synthase
VRGRRGRTDRLCPAALAGFKTPKHVVFQELPKTSTGKIQKFELRKAAADL